jgi:hypothetical protein
MHHKFCVRDGRDVWTGSMNWTEDSWTRQENVVIRVLGSAPIGFAFTLAFDELWEKGTVEGTGTVEPRPVELDSGIELRPWFTPGHGDALSHRVAKAIGRARRRVRIASPVLTAGPILGTLAEVVNERRCEVRGVLDQTQSDDVLRQWARNEASAWKTPLFEAIVTRGALLREAVDAVVARRRAGLHARQGRGLRRRVVRRLVQLLALGRTKRRERARAPRRGDGRRARSLRRQVSALYPPSTPPHGRRQEGSAGAAKSTP